MQDEDDLSFAISTSRLRAPGETVEQYDEHFWAPEMSCEFSRNPDERPIPYPVDRAPQSRFTAPEALLFRPGLGLTIDGSLRMSSVAGRARMRSLLGESTHSPLRCTRGYRESDGG